MYYLYFWGITREVKTTEEFQRKKAVLKLLFSDGLL